jgi:hypothetical protein
VVEVGQHVGASVLQRSAELVQLFRPAELQQAGEAIILATMVFPRRSGCEWAAMICW